MLRGIVAPEGSNYSVRHAKDSFAFTVVKSIKRNIPRVSCMPEGQTEGESFNIDASLQTESVCKTVRVHIQQACVYVCVCVSV